MRDPVLGLRSGGEPEMHGGVVMMVVMVVVVMIIPLIPGREGGFGVHWG